MSIRFDGPAAAIDLVQVRKKAGPKRQTLLPTPILGCLHSTCLGKAPAN